MATTTNFRPLYVIANEIVKDWTATAKGGKIYFGAVPYLNVMMMMNNIDDAYGYDSARSIVNYFLANSQTWRGEKAREIKKELNAMLKSK